MDSQISWFGNWKKKSLQLGSTQVFTTVIYFRIETAHHHHVPSAVIKWGAYSARKSSESKHKMSKCFGRKSDRFGSAFHQAHDWLWWEALPSPTWKFRRKLRVRISFQLHLIQNIWIRWFRWNFKLPPEDNEPSVPLSRPLLGTGCYPAGWTLPSAIECCELQLFIQDPAEERNQWGQELFSICQRHLLDNLMCSSAASLFIFLVQQKSLDCLEIWIELRRMQWHHGTTESMEQLCESNNTRIFFNKNYFVA